MAENEVHPNPRLTEIQIGFRAPRGRSLFMARRLCRGWPKDVSVKSTVRTRFKLRRASGQKPGFGATRFLDAVPSPSAMRMRRSRERRREGLRYLRIELRATEIDALVRKQYVKSEARNERNAIIQGLYEFLEEKLDDAP